MRQQLSAIYEREQNWREAANILVGIPLETAQKYVATLAEIIIIIIIINEKI